MSLSPCAFLCFIRMDRLKKFDIHENKPDQVQLFRVLEANTTIEELVYVAAIALNYSILL